MEQKQKVPALLVRRGICEDGKKDDKAAAADYRKAIELYGQVRGFADANRNVWFAQAWLRVVEKRIANLDDAEPR